MNFPFNLTSGKELIEDGFRSITPGEWARCVDHVKSVELTYWANAIAVDEVHEPIVIDLASNSDCSSDTDTVSETEGL